ncbi:MAG TPA: S41 family peptidase [Fimbriimonadaceae bacterium]|nr:S41 family peptidase [Fimbriimonadaceae bacterium]
MKSALKFIGVLAGIAFMFAFGFAWRDLQKLEPPSKEAFLALSGHSGRSPSTLSAVQVFRQSYHRILDRFAGKTDAKDLKYAAMEGMMASLGDPHTMFLPPEAAESFSIETKAKFVGVGARLRPDPLGARAVMVFEQGPGYRMGLRVGDWIVEVNGQKVAGLELNKIVSQIRGEEGTFVRLGILREGDHSIRELRVPRESVVTPTVQGRTLPETSIGYLAVDSFSEPTGAQFESTFRKLESEGIEALVVDVRGNPGGLLDTAREMLSLFIEDKVVVKMRLKSGKEEIVPSFAGNRKLIRMPTVILIDGDSASASEIFAGVLHDYRLATLIGETTFGKAAVQNVFKLKDNASAKITIAKYLLPSGVDISRKVDEDGQYVSGGIKPDIEVSNDPNNPPIIGDPKSDEPLKAAVELLRSKLGAHWLPAPTDDISRASTRTEWA